LDLLFFAAAIAPAIIIIGLGIIAMPMPPIIGIFMFDGGMFDDMHGCMFMPFMPFMPPDVP